MLSLKIEKQGWFKHLFALLLMVGMFMIPDISYAQGTSGDAPGSVGNAMEAGYKLVTGNTARWVAVIVLVFFGMMCLLGRLQITTLLLFVAAFALIFGAQPIVNFIKNAADSN